MPKNLEELDDYEYITFSSNGNGNGKKPNAGTVHLKKNRLRITIDLSQPKHRRNLFLGLFTFSVIGLTLIISGYEGYKYSESAEFCGTTCHTMIPQFTRYQKSEHMNVNCVECHVGEGTSYYIKSKVDGLHQVYALVTDTYSRPIKSPVHNLRPARETCENCHRPTSFKDNIVKTIKHFDNDELNTPIVSTLILKMGGWQEDTGMSQGIHWHITNPVYYIAADEQRQVILWIGVEQSDGSMKEFISRDMLQMAQTAFVEKARAEGQLRKMDCIDCHNRAAHNIPPPEKMVDDAIESGLINPSIPYIRSKSVEALKKTYASQEDAFKEIDRLMDYYRSNYPQVFETQGPQLDLAINQLKQMYLDTNFPDMHLDWKTNPNNEDHTSSAGCFRCHDGKHVRVDEGGQEVETISVSCNLCHTVPIVGRGNDLLVEAPVIVGSPPPSHADYSWTIEHQSISEAEKQDCYQCHGQSFCNNGVCHNLSHPPDMLYTHAEEYRKQGNQVCYTCHQDIHCSQCHTGGVIVNP